MKNNTMKPDRQAKTVSPREQLKALYDRIACLHLAAAEKMGLILEQEAKEKAGQQTAGKQLQKQRAEEKERLTSEFWTQLRKTGLYDRLGEAVLDFVTYTVKRRPSKVSRLCEADCLELDDIISEVTIQLVNKTDYIVFKPMSVTYPKTEDLAADQSNYRMALASTILNRAIIGLWRSSTKHFGKDLGVDPETGERRFSAGIRFSSLEELLENAYEPVLDHPSQDPMPEETIIGRENDKRFDSNAKQALEIIRAALTERQFAAFLIGAEKRGLDPRLTAAWSFDHGALFQNDRSLASAQHMAKKKLNSRAVKDQLIHIFC